jgi:hypothetical protein
MHGYSKQQISTSTKNRDFLKAKVIAEAGANQAYNKVKHDFKKIKEPELFPQTTLGDGEYDVTMIPVGEKKARMISIGRCGLSQATVMADLLNQEREQVAWVSDTPNVDLSAFTNYAVLAGGMIDWGGGGTITNGGLVKANNRLEMVGGGKFRGPNLKVLSGQQIYVQGSSYIYGDAYAPSFAGKLDQITTRHTEQVPVTVIPSIDLSPFYQRAYSNNQVRTGTFLINSDYSPKGGVLWVSGNLKISNGKCTGCFVATGDIDMSTSRAMVSTNGYPLLISRDGSIKVTSTADMKGLVYARAGSIDWTGGGTLKGSLVAAGDIGKGGGSDLIVEFNRAPPVIPDVLISTTNTTDYVIISAWQM